MVISQSVSKNGLHCPIMAVSRGATIDPVDGMGYPSFKFQGPESMIWNSVAHSVYRLFAINKQFYSQLLNIFCRIEVDQQTLQDAVTSGTAANTVQNTVLKKCPKRSMRSKTRGWQPQNRYSRKVGNQAILVLNIIYTYLYHPGSCSILFGDPYKLRMCQNHPKPEGIALRKTMKVRKRISECLQVMDRLDLGIECRDITRFIMRI